MQKTEDEENLHATIESSNFFLDRICFNESNSHQSIKSSRNQGRFMKYQ